jgi:hypothetical protein
MKKVPDGEYQQFALSLLNFFLKDMKSIRLPFSKLKHIPRHDNKH